MFGQIGTAVGMFLFVPLGDKFERRTLISILLWPRRFRSPDVALAQNAWWLAIACFAVGATAATVHVVVPFAAHLASPQQRGTCHRHGARRTALRHSAGPHLQRRGRRDGSAGEPSTPSRRS